MANIKSQIKRNRQNDKRRLRNRVYRGTARIAVKNARSAIDSSAPESNTALISAISALDKAAEQGVIHRNNAARRKSRLVKAFARMEPVKAAAEPAKVDSVAEPEPIAKKAAPRRRTAKAAVESEVKPAAKKKAAAESEAKPAPKKKAAATPKKKTPTKE